MKNVSVKIIADSFLLMLSVSSCQKGNLAANPNAGFTRFVYDASYLFTVPFQAVFRTVRVNGNIFEWTTILAMAVYAFLALMIIKFFIIGKPLGVHEAYTKLLRQDE